MPPIDHDLLLRAVVLAGAARDNGNHPFGALLATADGGVRLTAQNTVVTQPTGADPENPTLDLPCRIVFAAGQRPFEVLGPYDLPPAIEVHAGFWTRPTDV